MSATVSISEKAWQATVIETARACGWLVAHFRPARTKHGWRTAVQADGAGFPDIVAVRGDQIIYVELKAEKGRLSNAQAAWLAALGRAGASVHCWRPSDWDLVEAVLR